MVFRAVLTAMVALHPLYLVLLFTLGAIAMFGSSYASVSERLYGVTVEDSRNLGAIIDSLDRLPVKPWVRIVFHAHHKPAHYERVVAEIGKVSAGIIGQPADSAYVARLSLADYRRRFRDYIAAFPNIRLWEIGNEGESDRERTMYWSRSME
jgi:hypothetical protein